MNKKYELTKESVVIHGRTMYIIRALRDFGDVKAGDLGGAIESENNLSHTGNCWIYGTAWASENAKVSGNASISEWAWVIANARVCGESQISGHVEICGYAKVCGNAKVSGYAHVFGNTNISGNARVAGSARIYGNAHISGRTRVYGNAQICGDAWIDVNNWSYIQKNTKINHGVWNQQVNINGKGYLLSTTLEKILLDVYEEI